MSVEGEAVKSGDETINRRSGVFTLVFATVGPVIYVLCDLRNWPLFTYHPGPNRFDWFFVPPVRDWGPAMYWYGWTATTIFASAIVAGMASLLPARLTAKIPASLGWLTSVLAIPPLVWGLKFYWRWP